MTFNISTVRPTGSITHGQEVDNNDKVNLHNVWSVKRLPISVHSAVVSSDIKKLSYLKDIDVSNIDTKDVMLLIGTDSPAAHIPLEVRSGKNDQPSQFEHVSVGQYVDLLEIKMHQTKSV